MVSPTLPVWRVIGQSNGSAARRSKYQERTVAQFVSSLGFLIGNSHGKGSLDGFPHPRVSDKTALSGIYTFILEYRGAAEPVAGLPNIFAAVKKQPSLRLDKSADVPVDVIVAESVDKIPTEN
jgi:uncharacterized protein (TIGR03435 family)